METVHGTLVESAGYRYRSRYKEHKDGLENMNEKEKAGTPCARAITRRSQNTWTGESGALGPAVPQTLSSCTHICTYVLQL